MAILYFHNILTAPKLKKNVYEYTNLFIYHMHNLSNSTLVTCVNNTNVITILFFLNFILIMFLCFMPRLPWPTHESRGAQFEYH